MTVSIKAVISFKMTRLQKAFGHGGGGRLREYDQLMKGMRRVT